MPVGLLNLIKFATGGGGLLVLAPGNRVLTRERTGDRKHPLPTTQEKTTHGHHQMVNTKIRLIIFFAAKDGEALDSNKNKTRS